MLLRKHVPSVGTGLTHSAVRPANGRKELTGINEGDGKMPSPIWKVYRGKEYIGCVKYAEDAAALVALSPDDGIVKHGHGLIAWREGRETISAGNSYDGAAAIMSQRVRDHQEACLAKYRAQQAAYLAAHPELTEVK